MTGIREHGDEAMGLEDRLMLSLGQAGEGEEWIT